MRSAVRSERIATVMVCDDARSRRFRWNWHCIGSSYLFVAILPNVELAELLTNIDFGTWLGPPASGRCAYHVCSLSNRQTSVRHTTCTCCCCFCLSAHTCALCNVPTDCLPIGLVTGRQWLGEIRSCGYLQYQRIRLPPHLMTRARSSSHRYLTPCSLSTALPFLYT